MRTTKDEGDGPPPYTHYAQWVRWPSYLLHPESFVNRSAPRLCKNSHNIHPTGLCCFTQSSPPSESCLFVVVTSNGPGT
jgi:hypothetical protein